MRITIFAGHYGSGKTQIAVHFALQSAKSGRRTALCDLDIVNPYFRTEDARPLLQAAGVELICSEYAGTNAEMPSLPPDAVKIFDNADLRAFVDVGGDDGAVVLGRYHDRWNNEAELVLVYNPFRPLSQQADETVALVREIEAKARLSFSSMIANPNLGSETTAETITRALPRCRETAAALGLPIRALAVRNGLTVNTDLPILALELFGKETWGI